MRLDRSAGCPRRRRTSGLARRLSNPAEAVLEAGAGADLPEIARRLRLRARYRVLLQDPSGSVSPGAARLLGIAAGRMVYRVDLSRVVSKYIGETEKNLATLFRAAEDKRWILFFDEADALFGKRSEVKDAHDRYANQEVAYLLRRLQDYEGPVVFATARRGNLDAPFLRRFHAVVRVSPPAKWRCDAG